MSLADIHACKACGHPRHSHKWVDDVPPFGYSMWGPCGKCNCKCFWGVNTFTL